MKGQKRGFLSYKVTHSHSTHGSGVKIRLNPRGGISPKRPKAYYIWSNKLALCCVSVVKIKLSLLNFFHVWICLYNFFVFHFYLVFSFLELADDVQNTETCSKTMFLKIIVCLIALKFVI